MTCQVVLASGLLIVTALTGCFQIEGAPGPLVIKVTQFQLNGPNATVTISLHNTGPENLTQLKIPTHVETFRGGKMTGSADFREPDGKTQRSWGLFNLSHIIPPGGWTNVTFLAVFPPGRDEPVMPGDHYMVSVSVEYDDERFSYDWEAHLGCWGSEGERLREPQWCEETFHMLEPRPIQRP